MSMIIFMRKSDKRHKRYLVVIDNQAIHFGDAGTRDFTCHHDEQRKRQYINRHRQGENWRKTGIRSAGFWAKHILWNKRTIASSVKDTEGKFGVVIHRI